MTIDLGIVGAGNRGGRHAGTVAEFEEVDIVAIADIDLNAASDLAADHGDPTLYEDFRDMLAEESLDAISICLHNNLHAPVAIAAAEADCHIFCEKPIAATYADGKAIVDAAEEAGIELAVQNIRLFSDTTRAAHGVIADGGIGEPLYARGSFTRRRGRPYVDGYGTPSFVQADRSGGGAVIDIGVYLIGQLLYLVGNGEVERVVGRALDTTAEGYDPSLVGADADYPERVRAGGYDVEDLGFGTAFLADGTAVSILAAWHIFAPDEPDYIAGSKGGVRVDEFAYYTTDRDYEATMHYDLDEHVRRRQLIEGEDRRPEGGYARQYRHWIDKIEGAAEDPVDSAGIALNAQLLMEGLYQAEAAGRELTAEEIADRSESTAADI